jgi:hypothetical protein
MTERTKVYTIAHVLPDLERAWLQHLRDFDTAHPGCHFEVLAEGPGRPMREMLEMLRVSPGLTLQQVWERKP